MNFRGLLEYHIKFNEIESLLEPTSPVLLLGASNVLKGNLKIFSSRKGEFRVEAILASAAIPSIFPAMRIGEDYYWDGLFSDNPPVDELIQTRFMGVGNVPDEIWIILIDPITCKTVPTKPNEILDRRTQMTSNVSLLHDLDTFALLERIFEAKGFTEDFLKSVGYTHLPKIRFIQMSEEVQDSLDYPCKLSRHPDLINKLMEDGEKQAQKFCASLSEPAYTVEEAARKFKEESA